MAQRWTKIRWFGLGCLISLVVAVLGTAHLTRDLLAQAGGDPVLAPPPLAVATSVGMTFFSLLIPLVCIFGAVVVIVDGAYRGKKV